MIWLQYGSLKRTAVTVLVLQKSAHLVDFFSEIVEKKKEKKMRE